MVDPRPSAETWVAEKHHILTDKHREFTPAFMQLLHGTDITLQDKSNLVDLPDHKGRHPNSYHMYVQLRLLEATEGLTGLSRSGALQLELNSLANELLTKQLSLK
jgi:hypothetical protein